MEGVDYSFSRPDPSALVRLGKGFCCRYLSPPPNAKNLSRAEADRLRAAGLAIVSNWEDNGRAELLAGRASGQNAARQALALHAECGGPARAPVYFSCDFDAQVSQVIDFYRGVADVTGYDRAGCYGGFAVIEGLVGSVVRYGWQTFAWSGGRRSAKAHIFQHTVDIPLAGGTVDLNTSLQADFGQWGAERAMPRTKDEIRAHLNSIVGQSVAPEDGTLRGQCVSLIKDLMWFVGAPNPRAGRGNAAQAGDQYIAEGLGKAGRGWCTVCVNRQMAYPYGHIWIDIQGEFNIEQNGAVPLRVTKNTRPLSQAQQFVNFDQWVGGAAAPPPPPTPVARGVRGADMALVGMAHRPGVGAAGTGLDLAYVQPTTHHVLHAWGGAAGNLNQEDIGGIADPRYGCGLTWAPDGNSLIVTCVGTGGVLYKNAWMAGRSWTGWAVVGTGKENTPIKPATPS